MADLTEPSPSISELDSESTGPPSAEQPIAVLGKHFLRRVRWEKIGLFIVSIFLFILAINLMKEGARDLAPLVRDVFAVHSPANALGFGWLFAYLLMSGSPVAAAALTFFDAGVINELSTFTMITGSRLGASFIVLFIGFIYVVRGKDRSTGLSMGLLSLLVAGTTHLAGLVIGVPMIQAGILSQFQLGSAGALNSLVDQLFGPFILLAKSYLPDWTLFLVGIGIIMVSFSLFDRCLPQVTIKESQVGRVSRVVYRPGVMFLLGAGVTMISMSVSISLSILVPLSNRGFVRRENVIPYIMGANITTFVDTLLAAVLLQNPEAFTVVLVEMVTIALVSAVILLLFYGSYQRWMLSAVSWVTASNRNLALFMFSIFAVPILLMLS